MEIDIVIEQEADGAGNAAVAGEAREQGIFLVEAEYGAHFVRAGLGDHIVLGDSGLARTHMGGLFLQRGDFGRRKDVLEDQEAVLLEALGLRARQRRFRAPLAPDHGVLARLPLFRGQARGVVVVIGGVES
ncbi:hypothetical protein D3C87_1505170 [compost metagenome]